MYKEKVNKYIWLFYTEENYMAFVIFIESNDAQMKDRTR